IRQMSQPLGTSIAAVTVPPVAAAGGFPAYLWFVAAVTGTLAIVCFALVRNPPPQVLTRAEVAALDHRDPSEPAATAGEHTAHDEHEEAGPTSAGEVRPRPSSVFTPSRGDSFLWRIHAVSALLVIPQFAFSTSGLVWLIAVQGIGASAAGAIVAAAQIVGALGRMVVGGLSDRTGSRVGLMRVVAIAA